MMEASGVFSLTTAKAFLATTTKDLLVNPDALKKIDGINQEQLMQMEEEMTHLQKEYQIIEENYSNDVLNLTLAKGYLGSILENARIIKYLSQNNPDILKHFQKITEINSLS
jgi:G3E family GTPase